MKPSEDLAPREFNLAPSDILEGKRVLFIYPPVRLSQKPLYPPFGLMSLASVLEDAKASVEILDLNLLRLPFSKVEEQIRRRTFDIVGIGGMTTVYYYLKLLSLYLKRKYPSVPIMGGGSACSAAPRTVLANTGFDALCIGEGEPIIVALTNALVNGNSLSRIPGVFHKTPQAEIVQTPSRPRMSNLSKLPFPAYHLVDMEQYIENAHKHKHHQNNLISKRIAEQRIDPEAARRPMIIFSKRGCPFRCNFCYRNFGRNVVHFSVEYTLQHMAFLNEKYGCAHFVFGDETFNVNKDWVNDFCEKLIQSKQRYILGTSNGLRANQVDRGLLKSLKKAGFCSIGIGIESFYDPSLKAMNKGQTAHQTSKAIQLAREEGFAITSTQLLFGYATDGPEAMDANIEMLSKLGFRRAGFSIPCPYPGTDLYQQAKTRGLIENEEAWLLELSDRDISERVINMSSMSTQQMLKLIEDGLWNLNVNWLRKRLPVGGGVATTLIRLCKRFGIDALQSLDTTEKLLRSIGILSAKPSPITFSDDTHIRDEAFRLLESL